MNRCDSYVDMGEHNKPLCKRKGYRPAECELCPTRVASLEAENAKLRELVNEQRRLADAIHAYWAGDKTPEQFNALMRMTARVNRLSEDLGIEVES